jgi:hypothetical protein
LKQQLSSKNCPEPVEFPENPYQTPISLSKLSDRRRYSSQSRSETDDNLRAESSRSQTRTQRPDGYPFWTQTEFNHHKKQHKGKAQSCSLRQLLINEQLEDVSEDFFKGISNKSKEICQQFISNHPEDVALRFHNIPIVYQQRMFEELEEEFEVLALCQDHYKAKLFLASSYSYLPTESKSKQVVKTEVSTTFDPEDLSEPPFQTFARKINQETQSKLGKLQSRKDKGKGKELVNVSDVQI